MARCCHWLKVTQLMFNWRQTSAGLQRSVHTASTAWTLSGALCGGVGVRFLRSVFSVGFLVEVISKFLFEVLLITDTEFEFALFGAEHDGLAVHPPDHVEGRLGFAAEGEFEEVFLNALLDGFAQIMLDLEEAIGGTEALDALMRALVVVVFDPEFDPLAGGVKGIELGANQEVLPERGPEAFDLAQRHRMLRARFEMRHAILLELGLEPADAAPGGVLAAVVREHLLGRLELADGDAIDLNHRCGGGTAEQVRADDEPRVIIQEGDEIGVAPTQPEGEDIRLPHLIGRGALEEARAGEVALFGRSAFRHQRRGVQVAAHRLRAGREEEPAPEQLADAFDAEGRMLGLELLDLLADGRGQLGRARGRDHRLQPGFTGQAVLQDPAMDTALADVQFGGHERQGEALLEVQADGPEFFGHGVAPPFFGRARPPRGAVGGLFYYRWFIHVNTSFIIEVSTTFTLKSVS